MLIGILPRNFIQVKSIDGCCTEMLRMALNLDSKQNKTNQEVYGKLPIEQPRNFEKRRTGWFKPVISTSNQINYEYTN